MGGLVRDWGGLKWRGEVGKLGRMTGRQEGREGGNEGGKYGI